MRRLLVVIAALAFLVSPARADGLSEQDSSAFRAVIEKQIEAFRADDGARAYGYAAPMIQRIFPTPDAFMDMVRRGYQPVYRPQSFKFGDAGFSASGRPIQRLTVVGPDGLTYVAIYTMEQQPDGSWLINGCAIVRAPDINA